MSPLARQRAWRHEEEYGTINYTGAWVLDIGADYGTTAEFFLGRGAMHVVAVERNPEWRERLREWAKGLPVTVVEEPLTSANARALLEEHRPDIVKVDCEGCEALLLALPDRLIGAPRAWVMETHTLALFDAFTARFRRLGYAVDVVKDFGTEPNRSGKVCRVLTATRAVP